MSNGGPHFHPGNTELVSGTIAPSSTFTIPRTGVGREVWLWSVSLTNIETNGPDTVDLREAASGDILLRVTNTSGDLTATLYNAISKGETLEIATSTTAGTGDSAHYAITIQYLA